LIITAIHDRGEAARLFRYIFGAGFWREEMRPHLDRLPLVIRDLDLYFPIPDLRQAEVERSFEFEIEIGGQRRSRAAAHGAGRARGATR
jgi:hypothetical protein